MLSTTTVSQYANGMYPRSRIWNSSTTAMTKVKIKAVLTRPTPRSC